MSVLMERSAQDRRIPIENMERVTSHNFVQDITKHDILKLQETEQSTESQVLSRNSF